MQHSHLIWRGNFQL
uniref:Uncharacterized protein n=1 Tax=Anguilla anguilla TaxID=7936 RepID=A0A0E9Y0M4_ANGAN